MRFERFPLVIVLFFVSGCGMFGNRQDPNLTVTYNPGSIGCLNDIGTKITAYLAGTVVPADWQASVDCAASSIDQFKQFVQPSSPQGYTSTDLQAFLGKFLLTKFPDNADIVSALLKIKALVIGGTTDVVTFPELDRAKSLIGVIRTESLNLLPVVAQRAKSPSAATLLPLADALSVSGANIAAALAAAPGDRDLSWDDVTQVAAALARVLEWTEPAQLIPITTAAKTILFAGWSGGIEASLVPTLVQTGATLGGLAMAGVSLPETPGPGPNATPDFYVQLALRARPTVDAMLSRNGGALALTAIDTLLNALPAGTLPAAASLFEGALRPFVNTMLRSTTIDAIDSSVVNLLYQLAQDWDTSEIHLETIFNILQEPVDTLPTAFVNTATSYASGRSAADQALIQRLITIAGVIPLFEGEDGEMTFTTQERLSLGQLQKLLLIRMGAEQLLQSYSSVPGHAAFVESDLQHLLSDYSGLSLALHFLDFTIPNIAEERFQQADLFTMVSNGDGLLDINEGTYYLANFYSAETFASRVRSQTATPCGIGAFDSLGWEWMDPTCFRNIFFGGYLSLWDHFPRLVAFYSSLSTADQQAFQQAFEKSTRYYGYSQAPFANYDVGSMVGFMQYMETIFMRFNANNDGVLNLSDTMNIYPVFKQTLAKLTEEDPSDDAVLQAILTYLLKYSVAPVKTFPDVIQFVLWEAWKPFWEISANRMTVYSVMAGLTAPVSLPPVPNPSLTVSGP